MSAYVVATALGAVGIFFLVVGFAYYVINGVVRRDVVYFDEEGHAGEQHHDEGGVHVAEGSSDVLADVDHQKANHQKHQGRNGDSVLSEVDEYRGTPSHFDDSAFREGALEEHCDEKNRSDLGYDGHQFNSDSHDSSLSFVAGKPNVAGMSAHIGGLPGRGSFEPRTRNLPGITFPAGSSPEVDRAGAKS